MTLMYSIFGWWIGLEIVIEMQNHGQRIFPLNVRYDLPSLSEIQ